MELRYGYLHKRQPNYIRVRCPVCGMLARLDNVVNREPTILEEVSTYCEGYCKISHRKSINENLRGFWIKRLLYILKKLGWEEVKIISYDVETKKIPSYDYVPTLKLEVIPYAFEKK